MLAVAAFGFGATQTAVAQEQDKTETRHYPSWFVGVQGGAQAVMNGYSVKDVVTPVGALQGGAYFSPALGARVHVSGWQSKEGVKGFGDYKFEYVGANLDMMVNLTNAFSKRDDHRFNVIFLGGLGMNKAWGEHYNDLPGYAYQGQSGSKVEVISHPSNHIAMSERVGLQFDLRLGKLRNWGVNLEVQANHIDGRSYAHEFNGAKNWQLAGYLGVTYHFGKPKSKKMICPPAPVQPEPVQTAPVEEPVEAPVEAPVEEQTVVVQKEETPAPVETKKELAAMQEQICFVIGQSEIREGEAAKVSDIAAFMNEHPTATAEVQGYADKGTGTAAINARVAKQRAQAVADELTGKYGISADRLNVVSYGDTVQLFAENDKNRVVIVVAKEK